MVANNSPDQPHTSRNKKIWPLLNLLLTAVLLAIGFWYIMQRTTLAELAAAFASANPLFILLSFLSMVLTLVIKSWRWQILLTQHSSATDVADKPPFAPLFWAFNLGAYVNLVLPFIVRLCKKSSSR